MEFSSDDLLAAQQNLVAGHIDDAEAACRRYLDQGSESTEALNLLAMIYCRPRFCFARDGLFRALGLTNGAPHQGETS